MHGRSDEYVSLDGIGFGQFCNSILESAEIPFRLERIDADDSRGIDQAGIMITEAECSQALWRDDYGKNSIDAETIEDGGARHAETGRFDRYDFVSEKGFGV